MPIEKYHNLYFSSFVPIDVAPAPLHRTSWRQHMSTPLLDNISTTSLLLPFKDPTFTVHTFNTPQSPISCAGLPNLGILRTLCPPKGCQGPRAITLLFCVICFGALIFYVSDALPDRQPSPFIRAWDRHWGKETANLRGWVDILDVSKYYFLHVQEEIYKASPFPCDHPQDGRLVGFIVIIIIIIIVIIIIKTSSTGQSEKNKIVYKLLTQPHKHLHHRKLKNKLGEATNDWLLP